jgi:hypothetical protein
MSANISALEALIALTALSFTGFFQMKTLRKPAYAGTPAQSANCIFSAGTPAHLRGTLWT